MKVSVVIPTYNRRDLVLQAVESVLSQTLAPHEVIVVVDGSPDDTASVIRDKHPAVRVVEGPNRGLAVTRNRGIARATGDWVAFLDDDDLWHPKKLEHMAAYVTAHPDCEAMLCPGWFFTASADGPESHLSIRRDFVAATLSECVAEAERRGLSDKAAAEQLAQRTVDTRSILKRNQGLYISSATVRREVLISAGGSCPMYMQGEDWTLLLNVSRLTNWHVLDEKLVFTRFHGNQMSSGGPRTWLESLAGTVGVWHSGRPLPTRTNPAELDAALATFGTEYRRTVQGFFWASLARGDLSTAVKILATGILLLPRLADRAYSMVPPPVTWRFERYFLGMHK